MTRYFVDTSVFVIAAGVEHPHRDACRSFLGQASDAGWTLHISIETLQEFLFHRMRRADRRAALAAVEELAAACEVYDFDHEVWNRAIELVKGSRVRCRDAVLAATALLLGFTQIVTLDSDFDAVPDFKAVHPSAVGA